MKDDKTFTQPDEEDSLLSENQDDYEDFSDDEDDEFDREFREKYGPLLREVVIRLDEIIWERITQSPDYVPHKFSDEFERKMEILIETHFWKKEEEQG